MNPKEPTDAAPNPVHQTLAELQDEGKLLSARFAQTTKHLHAIYGGLIGTEHRPDAPTVVPGDLLPAHTPLSSAMSAWLDALQIQCDGSRELAEIDDSIANKAQAMAFTRHGSEIYEALLVELDGLFSARSAIWQEQINIVAIVQPMLAAQGFPLPRAADSATQQA